DNVISYSISAGNSQTYDLTFTPPSAGSYNGNVVITSNDPTHPTNNLAVTGTGVNPPDITVTPSSFSKTLPPDNTTSDTLFIGNAGDVTLDYTATVVYAKGNRDDLLNENFDSGIPGDWTIVDGYSDGETWYGATDYGGSTLDGTPFAFVDSDGAGWVDMDEQLITPEMDASSYTSLTLEFDHYFLYYSGGGSEKGDVDIWDGSNWQNVARFTSTTGSWTTPDHQTIDILTYANANLKVRFHYYDANYDWYWAVDNIVISGTGGSSDNWLTLNGGSSVNGSVPAGSPDDEILVGFDSNGLTDGTYNADIVITSNDPDESPYTVPVTLSVSSVPTLGNLDGYVTEYGTKAPIENAVVTISTYSDTTDVNGYYFIENIPVGTYDVTATADTYFESTITGVSITDGTTTQIDFELMWAEIDVSPSSFDLTVSPDEIVDTIMTITNDGPGDLTYSCSIEFLTKSKSPSILVVDRDGSAMGSYTDDWPYFQAALDANGYNYTYYEVTDLHNDGPNLATMQLYDIIIWFSGEVWGYYGDDCMTANDEVNLADYLDDGGALFLSAQDYLWASYPSAGSFSSGEFPYDYLGMRSVSQDNWLISSPSTGTIEGVSGSLAEGYTFNIQDIYTTTREGLWIDEITSHVGIDMFNVTSPTPEGICALQYESVDFKTVFTTASFAAITSSSVQADLMADVIGYLTPQTEEWLSITANGSGTVPGWAKGSVDVSIRFDATGLTDTTKTANIVITNNAGPTEYVPVTMIVSSTAQPEISVNPDSLDYGKVLVGSDSTQQFSIENTGTAELSGNITTPTDFTVASRSIYVKGNGAKNVLSFNIPSGQTLVYDLTFTPSLEQTYSDSVVITSNDPINPIEYI
ncbi:MAG: hypothetical protein DRH57_09355, partial [Candidatus Cloacimonadota bacterium]